ncbi:MAG: helicase-related protein [Bacteroidota bacterium]
MEEDMQLQFPDATVGRMDFDTTRTKTGYEEIIEAFETGKTDILVGTQMITKGLDFDNVTLVGIFDADRMMHFPDLPFLRTGIPVDHTSEWSRPAEDRERER